VEEVAAFLFELAFEEMELVVLELWLLLAQLEEWPEEIVLDNLDKNGFPSGSYCRHMLDGKMIHSIQGTSLERLLVRGPEISKWSTRVGIVLVHCYCWAWVMHLQVQRSAGSCSRIYFP